MLARLPNPQSHQWSLGESLKARRENVAKIARAKKILSGANAELVRAWAARAEFPEPDFSCSSLFLFSLANDTSPCLGISH